MAELTTSFITDSETRKTWAEVHEIEAQLKELDNEFKSINPAYYASVLFARDGEMWVGADWEYKSSYDWDDSIGMRCFEKMRTETPQYGKPWTLVGYVELSGETSKLLSLTQEDVKFGLRACEMVWNIYREAADRASTATKDSLEGMQRNYALYHTATGEEKELARHEYARYVSQNPQVVAANGFPQFAHLKMSKKAHG